MTAQFQLQKGIDNYTWVGKKYLSKITNYYAANSIAT